MCCSLAINDGVEDNSRILGMFVFKGASGLLPPRSLLLFCEEAEDADGDEVEVNEEGNEEGNEEDKEEVKVVEVVELFELFGLFELFELEIIELDAEDDDPLDPPLDPPLDSLVSSRNCCALERRGGRTNSEGEEDKCLSATRNRPADKRPVRPVRGGLPPGGRGG